MDFKNCRDYLHAAYRTRKQRNPRYSLRAFARDLGVSQPRLSDILAGRRRMSQQSALKFAANLHLDQLETDYFCVLVQSTDGKSEAVREAGLKRLAAYRDVPSMIGVEPAIEDTLGRDGVMHAISRIVPSAQTFQVYRLVKKFHAELDALIYLGDKQRDSLQVELFLRRLIEKPDPPDVIQ